MKKLLFFLIAVLCIVIAFFAFERYKENPDSTFSDIITGEIQAPEELTDVGSPYKFYYGTLDDEEKRAYNAILSEVYTMPESIRIPDIDTMQLDDVFWALLCDNPDLFFLGRCCTLITNVFGTSCSLEYCIDKSEYETMKKQLDEACDKVISSLSAPDDQWQTELEIHDYIVNNCEYRMEKGDYLLSSSYGVLVNGAAACEGYSKAAKLLLDRAGIESEVLCGTSTGIDGSTGNHMWNSVVINGERYYLDCTWDDPVSDDGEQTLTYSYFNINDEMISKTHSEFTYEFNCTATAENYYVKTGRYFENYSRDDESALARIIAESGGETVEIRFGSEKAYNAAFKDLFKNGRIYRVLEKANGNMQTKISAETVKYNGDSELLILTLIPERR